MAWEGKGIEAAVAFAGGLVWLGFCHAGTAAFEPGMAALAGAAGLASIVTAGFRRYGVESKATLNAIRKRTRGEVEAKLGKFDEQLDLREADAALAESLKDCFPDRDALVKAAEDKDGFPARATAIVMQALAAKHPGLFVEREDRKNAVPIRYAREVVHNALVAAVTTPEYFQKLQPHLELLAHQNLAKLLAFNGNVEKWFADIKDDTNAIKNETVAIREDTTAIRDGITEIQDAILELLSRQPKATDGDTRFAKVQAEVAKAIERDPTLSGEDIVKQVVNLITSRENALRELAAIPLVDNRIRSFQAAAEEALVSNDSAKALSALHAARAAVDERREHDARLSAKYATAQAELLLGEGKWKEADAIWTEAEALLEPIDVEAAEGVEKLATKKLFEFGDNFVDNDATFRSFQRCSQLLNKADVNKDKVKWAKLAIFSSHILTTAGSLDENERSQHYIDLAFDGFVSALKLVDKDSNYELWLQGICGLGTLYALKAERIRAKGESPNAYIVAKNAGDTFEMALSALKEDSGPEERAGIACGIGHARLIQGDSAATQDEGVALFSESMRALQYADSQVTERNYPRTWAKIQMHAGCTLMEASKWVQKEIRVKLAFDAVTAIRASLRVYSELKTPNDWAQANCYLGGALMSICERSRGEDWEKLRREGIEAFSAALRVWNQRNFSYGHETVVENIEKLRAMTPTGTS